MNSLAKEEYQIKDIDNSISNKKLFSFLFQAFLYGTVVGTISLLVPLYALNLGASTVQVGLIAGCRGMGHFLLVVPVGLLIDKFGIRKVFIISSFCSFLIIGSIPFAKNPDTLLIFSLIEGLTCSVRLTSVSAWSFDLLPFLKPTQTGWYKGAVGTGTTIIGPIIASLLAENIGYSFAFITVAIIVLIVNLIEFFWGTSTGPKEKVTENDLGGLRGVFSECFKLLKMLKNPRLLFVAYVESINSAFNSCFRILIILLVVGLMQKSSGLVSLVTTCVGVAYLIVVFFGGFILKYLKSSTIYLIAAFITSISLFIFATNQEILSISIASVFSGIGLGTLSLVNYKTIGGLKGESGKISGIITFTTGVTLCMAPMTISCITEMSSFKAGFLTLITPFALLIILVIFRGKIRNGALSIIGLKEKKNVLNS